jgi:hypothetical protein
MTALAELQGLWRRSLITWPGRGSDTTTTVRWLQGPRAYIDLRQPTPLPDFSHAHSLNDLTRGDCMWLARQEGFAGYLSFDGTYFEWHREIDFQPRAARRDSGTLHWEGTVLVETGRDGDYVEHWHRDPSPVVDHPSKTVLRVGPYFMLVRDRAIPLDTTYPTLAEHVAAASNVERARELIDCEISFGETQEDGLRITASTLPYRVGTLLELEQ